jgi:nucleotide-binding universal stress UspA family protein
VRAVSGERPAHRDHAARGGVFERVSHRERLVPGSLAEAVMRQASVPVVLVPPGARPG